MASFTDAASGNAQNVTQQNQLANAFNGSVTTTASIAPYGSTTKLPLQAFASSAAASALFGGQISGDAGWRFTMGLLGAGGQGVITQRTSSGTGQSNWYYNGTNALKTDFALQVNAGATLDGTVTVPGLTLGGSSNFSGTFQADGTVNGVANNLANGGIVNTATAGASLALNDDGTNLNLNTNAPAGAARNLALYGVDASNVTHLALTAKSDGTSAVAVKLNPANGGAISRISTAAAGLPFSSCTPSCFGTATVSHGLGTKPFAGTSMCGDGGSGSTNTFIQGFDNMGTSTVRLWCTETGGTNFVRFICYL